MRVIFLITTLISLLGATASFADGSASFNQTNWGGGQSDSPAQSPTHNTGWTHYKKLKDSLLSVVNNGADLIAVGPIIFVEHTTDNDFAFATDTASHTADADFTTAVGGVAPVLDKVVVSGGSIRLASGEAVGTYTSSLVDTYFPTASDVHYGLKNVQFSSTVPSGTKISGDGDPGNFLATIYVRAGSSTSPGDVTWTPWEDAPSGYTVGLYGERRYVQYQARLETTNVAVSPTLNDVTVGFVKFPAGPGLEVASGSVALKAGFASGIYTSKILDLGKPRELVTLEYDRTVPSGSDSVQIFVRASDQPSPTASPGDWTAWTLITAASPATLASLGIKRYFQYKAEIFAPTGGSPTLDRVKLNYRDDPDTTEKWLSSSRFDTNNAASHVDAVYWTENETLPAGAEVRMQLASATTGAGITDTSFVGPGNLTNTYWDSANTDGGGCFKRSIWVACTALPPELNSGGDDQLFAYKVFLKANSGSSPTVSDVIVRYGTGNLEGVTVIPTSGIVLSEADTTTVFKVGVVLHKQPAGNVIINATSGDTSEVLVNGGATQVLTFTSGNWSTPQDVNLTAVNDSPAVVDGDKTVTVTLSVDAASDAAYLGVDVPDISVTNKDDDIVTATIVATDENAAEAGLDPGVFTISLSQPAVEAINVDLDLTTNANPLSDFTWDYVDPVPFAIGEQFKTITLTPINDNFIEGNETVTITLKPGNKYLVGTPGSATVTLLDDDVPSVPTVNVTASSTNAREADGTQGFFSISRTGLKTNPLAVFFAIGGTATPVSDYTAISGSSAIIPAGSSNVVIAVKPVNDSAVEGNETVTLTLSTDANYLIGSSGTATVTIIDDDSAPAPAGGGGGGGAVGLWFAMIIGACGAYRVRRRMMLC